MNSMIRSELLPGVFLTTLKTDKFKTGFLRAAFVRPLKREEASYNAVLPMILRRGSERYPDMESLQAALDDMYGARIEPFARKKGEAQCFGFTVTAVEDRYVNENGLLEKAASLIGETLLKPKLEGGAFVSEYVSGEAKNQIDRINAQINDKRVYARNRIFEVMCENEPYSINVLGDVEVLSALEPQKLYEYYENMLATSRLELFYCGGAEEQRVKEAFLDAFKNLPGKGETAAFPTRVIKEAGKVKEVTENMDVMQGKLCLGFRCGTAEGDADFPALYLLVGVYGAGTTSKLFLNVRERLSLCYYASAAMDGIKGVMAVQSGTEFSKMDTAKEEILLQLDNCKKGNIEDWELESARETLISGLKLGLDSQSSLEDYYLGRAVSGVFTSHAEMEEALRKVTKEDVVRAAGGIQTDSVYYLKGLEGKA